MSVVEVVIAGPAKDVNACVGKLLHQRLVACAQKSEIDSEYWWDGQLVSATEMRATLHTTGEKVTEIFKLVEDIHSYLVPCAVVFPMAESLSSYANWVRECVK